MPSRNKVYLLTGGLVPLLENRHNVPLSDEIKQSLRLLEQYYFTEMRDLIGKREDSDEKGNFSWEMKFISDREIDSGLRKVISENGGSNPIISFDDVYCQDLPDGNYHVTRIQNPHNLNEPHKLGPRFRAVSLDEQVRQIKKRYGKKIDLMDVGTFEGGTLGDEIENRFRVEGIEVEKIYLAFAGKKGIEKLNAIGLNTKYVQSFDWIDWLEMRDCLGFDGRKVPMRNTDNSANLFIKYSENPENWASIPKEFVEDYKIKYKSFFKTIKSILAMDEISVALKPSKRSNIVYELIIKRKKNEEED
ncbi:hypothetical protein J4474_03930 [Candidatus Pacearchaeota archaeon]|nr:hypothetical protein [Candidatus Pacearchaeota archaeon]